MHAKRECVRECESARAVDRAWWCRQRALDLPLCLLCLGPLRGRSAENSLGPCLPDSQRPPTQTTTRSSRLEFPSTVALPQDDRDLRVATAGLCQVPACGLALQML